MSIWRLFGRKLEKAPVPAPTPLALIEEGNRFEESGQLDLAGQRYEAALRMAPEWPKVHLNIGNLLHRRGDLEGALASYRQVLRLDPAHAGAHFNIGNLHLDEHKLAEAFAAYREALQRNPDFVDAHVAMGYLLDEVNQLDAAIASYERALALRPDYIEVVRNIGAAHRKATRFTEALRWYDRAIAMDPSDVDTHAIRGHVLRELGRMDDAEAGYHRAIALQPDHLDASSGLLFLHNYRADRPPLETLAEARRFGGIVAASARPFTTWNVDFDPERPLRVGLVSGDLRQHPVGFFLLGVLSAWASAANTRVQLHAYPSYRCDDDHAQRMRACCTSWTPIVNRTDEEVANTIRNDRIDILIDLSGHTSYNRLPMFAWKPSPLAITWLGYFATTGVAAIDHLLADPWTLPPALESGFTEHVWRLPRTRLCFTPPDHDVAVNALPAAHGAPLTFGCFNNLTKVTDEVLALWARVLAEVPGARLLLKAAQLSDPAERERIGVRLAQLGVAADRVSLEGLSGHADYLASYGRVDIGLDPFPFPGGTTTAESLWMGVPVLTLPGASFLSRQGAGLLMNAGLADWVASDAEDYLRRAVAHAADLDRLAALRAGLRAQVLQSPIFDAPRFVDDLETALREMWRERCR